MNNQHWSPATNDHVVMAAAAASAPIAVNHEIYTLIAMAIGFVGVVLARTVYVDQENRRLGRVQTFRETSPLTGVAMVIVLPIIWHLELAIPYAALLSLGVGYAAMTVLGIIAKATAGGARSAAKAVLESLPDLPPEQPALPPDMERLLDDIDKADENR